MWSPSPGIDAGSSAWNARRVTARPPRLPKEKEEEKEEDEEVEEEEEEQEEEGRRGGIGVLRPFCTIYTIQVFRLRGETCNRSTTTAHFNKEIKIIKKNKDLNQ